MVFILDVEQLTCSELYTLSRVLGGAWEFAQLACIRFCGSGEAFVTDSVHNFYGLQ